MDNDLGTLSVGIALETAGLAAGLSGARDMLGGFAAVAATALAGAGVAMTKMAGNFEQANTLLVTSANESQKNLALVSAGILKTAVDTGTSTQSLQSAMFTIESSGAHGAAGLAELKAAAEGAKVENADLTGVVQALTTTMHDWREPASQAVDVMNSFREAASIGQMRMDDFTGAMRNVGPVASLLKIPLTDIEAALSTMSLEGDKGAAAGTHLAQSLMNMLHPSSAAVGVLSEIGLTSQQVSDDLKKSLPDTLALITESLAKKFPEGSAAYNAALATMFGGTRGLKSILELTGQNLQDFEKDAAAIAPTMQANATAVDGWARVQQNWNFKLDQGKAMVEALGIKIGMALLPVAGQLYDKVSPLIQHFSDWIDKGNNLQGVLSIVGGVIQSDVVDPAVKLYNAVEPIVQDFITWNDKTHFLGNTLHDVGGFINTVAGYVANNLVPPIRSLIGNLEQWLSKSNLVHDALQTLGGAIGSVTGVLGTLVGWVSGLVGWFVQASPPAQIVAGLLYGIGAAIATIKIEEFVLGLGKAVTALGGLGDILPAIVTKLLPNLAGALGIVSGAAPAAATQLSLFSAAELGAGTAATSASTGVLGMLASLAPVAAVVAGVTVAAEGLRIGLSHVAAALLGIPEAAMSTNTQIFALGGTMQMLGAKTAQTGSSMTDSMKSMKQSVVLEFADMSTGTQQQVEQMRTQVIHQLELLQGLSAKDATQMADQWIAEANKMKDQTSVSLGKMNASVQSQLDTQSGIYATWEAGSTQTWAQYWKGISDTVNQQQSLWSQSVERGLSKAEQTTLHYLGVITQDVINAQSQWAQHVDRGLSAAGMNSITGSITPAPGHMHALGGFIPPGDWGVAGDPGPNAELVYGGQAGATVFPHGQSMSMLDGALPSGGYGRSGGGTIVIEHHTHVELDGREIGHAVSRDPVAVEALGNAIVSRMRLRTGIRY